MAIIPNWTEEETEILRNLYSTSTRDVIHGALPTRTWESIKMKANRLNLKQEDRSLYKKKEILLDFSVIDTEEKAYILGFIAADGSLVKREGNRSPMLQIALSIKDKEHLELLHSKICPSASILYTNWKNTHNILFRICDQKLSRDLFYQGIVFNKTYFLQPPQHVPHELFHHWVRGYFDGDGTIYFRPPQDLPTCALVAYGEDPFNKLLLKVHNEFLNFYGCNCRCVEAKDRMMDRISYSSKKAVCFVNWLYKDATIYLNRKRELARPYLVDSLRKEHCWSGEFLINMGKRIRIDNANFKSRSV